MNKNKFKFYLFIIFFLISLAYLFFNESGVLRYLELKSELNNLKNQITSVQQDNKMMKGEIDSLQKKIPAKIDRVAREKYGMIGKGERRIKVIEK